MLSGSHDGRIGVGREGGIGQGEGSKMDEEEERQR